MTRLRQFRASHYGTLAANVGARIGQLLCLFTATLVVARNGGPAVVGVYALLHVLPGLAGTIISSGLPGAVAYFLAGPSRDDRRLPLTICTLAAVGGAAGAGLWIFAAPFAGGALFPALSLPLVLAAGALVLTRLVVTTAKSCSQGSNDLAGANRVIFLEEFMFLPAYALLWGAGVGHYGAVVLGLVAADVATGTLSWARLIRRGFFDHARRPSPALAREVAMYGLRAQVGTVTAQLNLRLDFVLLSVLTTPALLGVYAVASKFAELVKILGMALTYVLYPKFAREERAQAAANARRLMPKAGALTAAAVVALWVTASFAIPAVYGSSFSSAIVPAQIILLGLALDGVAGVITGFWYGSGRPGVNSAAMAVGLAVTVVLDVLLIPRFHAIGAATASAVAYMTTTLTLIAFFWWLGRRAQRPVWDEGTLPSVEAR